MSKTLYHEEIGGGYAMGPHIILDAADFRETDGYIEVMALNDAGDDLDSARVQNEVEAKSEFDKLVQKYAGPFQKAMYAAGLIPGHKYTLVYWDEIGIPMAQKITLESMCLSTYAQYGDAVKMVFRPFRKRSNSRQWFYRDSMMIFDGWQDMTEDVTHEVVRETAEVKVLKSKYSCFSDSFFEAAEKFFKNPVMIYKNYKVGESRDYVPDYDALEAAKAPAVEADKPGEYAYYYEMAHAPTGCDFSAELSYYGGHYFLRPLRDGLPKLHGRGITYDEQYNTYQVTSRAYSKIKEQYKIKYEMCFD